MSLRYRIIIILCCIFFSYLILNYGVQHFIIYPSFQKLETEEGEKNANRCVEAIEREIHHLNVLTHDWSAWDDTVEFVHDLNEEYIETNLVDSTFLYAHLNMICFYDLKGNLLWRNRIYNAFTAQFQEFSQFFFPFWGGTIFFYFFSGLFNFFKGEFSQSLL